MPLLQSRLSFLACVLLLVLGIRCGGAVAELSPLPSPNARFGNAYYFGLMVKVVAPLPDGGFLIGGTFNNVNGVPRAGLARLNADGSLDLGWDAGPAPNADIRGIVIVGSDAYIAGTFSYIGGQERHVLARISLSDGRAVPRWRADVDQPIYAIATDGVDLILAGNQYMGINGALRSGLAKVSLASGAVSPWTNDISTAVEALAVDGDVLYVGSNSLGLKRMSLSSSNSIDPGWGIALDASDGCCSSGFDMALSGSHVYAGGLFRTAGGASRPYLARVSKAPGSVLDATWNPVPDKPVYKILPDDTGVFLAGEFDAVNGVARSRIAEVDLISGATKAWNPGLGATSGYTLAAADGFIYAGFFSGGVNVVHSSVMKVSRAGITDEAFRVFASGPGGSVRSIAHASDGRTYIGGTFMGVNGISINGLARFNSDASLDSSWRPNPDGHVLALALVGSELVVGGTFKHIGGVARNRVAKLPTTGTPLVDALWDPNIEGASAFTSVSHIAVDGANVFLAGSFEQASGNVRKGIAKFPTAGTGSVDISWDPGWAAIADVRALAAGDGALFVGGYFPASNTGQANLVKLSGSSGARDTAWTPVVDGGVIELLLEGPRLYAGGEFSAIGEIVQRNLARLDAFTGAADSLWRPTAQDAVWSMAISNGVLYTANLPRFPSNAGATAAFSASTGNRDLAWSVPSSWITTLQPRGGAVWTGIDAVSGARIGMAAYPETVCGGKANGSSCESASSAASSTCQANVCVAARAARHDFGSDRRPDLIYRNAASGATYIWHMNGTTLGSDQYVTTIDPSWSLVGHGDFNGDGKNDLVWRNNVTGSAYVWYMKDGVYQSDAFLFTVDPIWKIEAVADFNKDGKPDFLFRHQTSGVGFIWYYDNTTPVSDQFLFGIDNSWIVENVGDFDRDGYPDFFFRNTRTGVGFVWYWDGTALGRSNYMFGIDPVWEVVEIADWNLDGNVDLLFRNRDTGLVFVWYTDGTSLQGSDFVTQIDPSWKIAPYR